MKNREKESGAPHAENRLGAVDIIVIVIVAAGIFAAVYFGLSLLSGGIDFSHGRTQKKANIEYRIRIDDVDTEVFAFIKGADNALGSTFLQVGDAVYDIESGKEIGKLTAMEYEDSRAPTGVLGTDGSMIYAERFGFIDVTLTVEAAASSSNPPYSVNGYELKAGDTLAFRTYGYYAEGTIISIEPAAEEEDD